MGGVRSDRAGGIESEPKFEKSIIYASVDTEWAFGKPRERTREVN